MSGEASNSHVFHFVAFMKGGVQSADKSENDNDMIEIRSEEPGDSAAIQEVHTKAFGGPLEAKLVRLITERKKALISLVAVRDDIGRAGLYRACYPDAERAIRGGQCPSWDDVHKQIENSWRSHRRGMP